MRSQVPMNAFRLCSTRRIVVPRLRIVRTRSITRPLSSRFMPVTGSSSSRRRGCAASAIAIPSTRWWPCGKFRVSWSACDANPVNSSTSRPRAISSAGKSRRLNSTWRGPLPLCRCRPSRTFSRAVISWKSVVSWNVRTSPRAAIWCGLSPVMSWPSKTIEPRVGRRNPLNRLKQVVLPAPLGPIRPTISPLSTVRSTRLTAARPPNSRVSSRASRIATKSGRRARRGRRGRAPGSEPGERPRQRDETAGQEQDGQQHGDREEDRLVRASSERLREQRQEGRADDRADEVPAATDVVVDQDVRRHEEAELRRKQEPDEVSVERPGRPREETPEHEGQKLVAGGCGAARGGACVRLYSSRRYD